METMNVGANAATFGERFLTVAIESLSGKNVSQINPSQVGLATLIISNKGEHLPIRSSVGVIPSIILAPGLLSFRKFKEIFKKMRNKISSEYRKNNLYLKKK